MAPERIDLVDPQDDIGKRAFCALLDVAAPLSMSTLAERLNVPQAAVREALDQPKLVGRVELDGDSLIGIFGLTFKPTEHRLSLRGSEYFTWCAYDTIGMPAALGESAEVSSICAGCGAAISLTITDGEPPSMPVVISWLYDRCDSIREQFCPTVNFYCDESQYEEARSTGRAPDTFLSLERAAELGRENWGWARSHSRAFP